ncbi:MAG: (2Fe-2S) ferredoxin domain-containing protein [Treponema sp.]|nr:(2Fe-2S) ferredoxin domain-containing protein [Treponema sp.]
MAKLTLEELQKLREKNRQDMRRRESVGKETQVIIGMGTCGIAAGAKGIMDTIIKILDENKLMETVLVRQVGCMGFCKSNAEPSVEVAVPGMPLVIYGNVDASLAKDIVLKHIIGRELLEDKIVDRPAIGGK